MGKIKLDNINKNHPFKVPDNYFEELSTHILERKSQLQEQKSSWVWSPSARLALVISFVFVLIFTIVFVINDKPSNFDEYLADVSSEDIVAYLASSDLSELDLLEMVDDDAILYFEIEDDILNDFIIDDEALDDLFLDYGLTDELTEI